MEHDKSFSPARSLVEAQRRLLHQLRLTRSKWSDSSQMGGFDSNLSAWSKTVWAETASPEEGPDLAHARSR